MKKLHIHGMWLVLQIISTTQENAMLSNMNTINDATSKQILLPTPSILKSSNQQTVLVHKSSSIGLEKVYTNTPKLQSSGFSNSRTLMSAFTPERTQTQSVRNLYYDTQSTTVRDLFKNTQIRSVDLQNISPTESALVVLPNRTYVGNKSTETGERNSVSSSTFGVHKSPTKVTGSSRIVQYTTGLAHSYSSVKISSTHARKTSAVPKTYTSSTMDVFQGRTTESQSSSGFLYTKTVESRVGPSVSNSRSDHRIESSSNYRFLSSTQTAQPSRIINLTLSRASDSATEKLELKTRLIVTSSRYINKNQSSFMNIHQSSTLSDFETSKTVDGSHITSSYRSSQLSSYTSSQFSRHGSNSYLANTEYLSSTANANKVSRIKPTTEPTRVPSISQTFANKESANTQRQSSSQKKTLESLSSSFSKDILSESSMVIMVSEFSSTILETMKSGYQSRIKSTNEVTDYKSQQISTEVHILSTKVHILSTEVHILSTEVHILSTEVHILSTTLTTTRYNKPSDQGSGMPLYVLAICLPLAALLGFTLACVYFRRNKEDHRVRYSVTVEISSEKPDYELKRMYSIIDVTGGINKDFLSGLESRKGSKGILDQLDNVSVSFTQPDQTV